MTGSRSWTALAVRFVAPVDDVTVDLASGELFGIGAEGIEQRDGPPFELVASFAPSATPEQLVGAAQAALQRLDLPVGSVTVDRWPDVDWSTHWRRHFRPLAFGRVWVVPHWLRAPPSAEVVLRIDPGMAFGTGLHPTTALCLDRIEALSPIDRLLDVGTGTGILALAAAALGATGVATDNDPVAIEAATENARINGLSERLTFTVDDEVSVPGLFSLVVANILAEPLVALRDRLQAKVAPAGRLLLSGLIDAQSDAVAAAYRRDGWSPPIVARRDEWVSLEFVRSG